MANRRIERYWQGLFVGLQLFGKGSGIPSPSYVLVLQLGWVMSWCFVFGWMIGPTMALLKIDYHASLLLLETLQPRLTSIRMAHGAHPSRQSLGPADVEADTPPESLPLLVPGGRNKRWLGMEWLCLLSPSDM